MRIEHLKVTNFRNYSNLEIDFSKNVNIFIGDNGRGKTNILESIYVLSLTKTNRYGLEENLIKFDEQLAKIEGMIRGEDSLKKLEVKLSKNKKQIYINNKEMRRIKDYIYLFEQHILRVKLNVFHKVLSILSYDFLLRTSYISLLFVYKSNSVFF